MTQTATPNNVETLISEQLREVARDAIKDGLDVYISPPTASFPVPKSHFYVSDGNRIGYCEYSRTHGIVFSTVHMPSTSVGTGARVSDGWAYFPGIIREVRASLAYAPEWWRAGTVEKYMNFDHFNRRMHKGALIKVTL